MHTIDTGIIVHDGMGKLEKLVNAWRVGDKICKEEKITGFTAFKKKVKVVVFVRKFLKILAWQRKTLALNLMNMVDLAKLQDKMFKEGLICGFQNPTINEAAIVEQYKKASKDMPIN
jgi:hypothetical protein